MFFFFCIPISPIDKGEKKEKRVRILLHHALVKYKRRVDWGMGPKRTRRTLIGPSPTWPEVRKWYVYYVYNQDNSLQKQKEQKCGVEYVQK